VRLNNCLGTTDAIEVDELTSILPATFLDHCDSPVHCNSPAAYTEIIGSECVDDVMSSVARGGEHGYLSHTAKGNDHGYTCGKRISIRKRRTRRQKQCRSLSYLCMPIINIWG
jgi:hypothetical protein